MPPIRPPHFPFNGEHLLLQGVTDYAIYMLDPAGHILSWNTGGERIKGYTDAEVIGQHFSHFYPPEDVALGLPGESLAIAAREGRYETEGWRVRKDGSRFRANIVIDVEGYKSRREVMLRRLAKRMAEQAIQRGRTVSLEPMPPHERRIIHLTLRDNPNVTTESVGEGDHRKVTIVPRR